MENTMFYFMNSELVCSMIAEEIQLQLKECDVCYRKRTQGVFVSHFVVIRKIDTMEEAEYSLVNLFMDELSSEQIVQLIVYDYLFHQKKNAELTMGEVQKVYEITIEETLAKTITVKASNEYIAEKKARSLYYDEKVVLTAEDLQERRMEVKARDNSYCSDWMKV